MDTNLVDAYRCLYSVNELSDSKHLISVTNKKLSAHTNYLIFNFKELIHSLISHKYSTGHPVDEARILAILEERSMPYSNFFRYIFRESR